MSSESTKLATLELFIYLAVLISSIFIINKHGLGRSLSWVFIALLSVSRVVGSYYQIHTANDSDAARINDALDTVDLAPLLSTLTCLLHYLYYTHITTIEAYHANTSKEPADVSRKYS